MKKIFSTQRYLTRVAMLAMLCGQLSLLSCDNQLEEELHGVYDTDEYFSSVSLTEMAVRGVYEVFSEMDTYGQNAMVYDTDTDISYVEGITGIGHTARDIGHYNIYAAHAWFENTWNDYYAGINRANNVVEGVKAHSYERSDSFKIATLVGEAKFLRALCYFDLVRLFGDVPFTLTPTKPGDNLMLPQTDRDSIYVQIIKDLEAAYAVLPAQYDHPSERATQGAAAGMLARVYLFRAGYSLNRSGEMHRPGESDRNSYYEQVRFWTEKVINMGMYKLYDTYDNRKSKDCYEQLFRNFCEYLIDHTETIFEVAFYNPSGETKHSGTWGTYNGPSIDQNSNFGRANSFIKTQLVFANKFEPGDVRKHTAIADYQIKVDTAAATKGQNIYVYYNNANYYNSAPGKWRRDWHAGLPNDNNNTNVNAVLLRYADILLMRAEVENELMGPDAAIPYINRVRYRAFNFTNAGDYTSADFGGSKDAFRATLMDERARELCFELPGRRADLIRWNVLGQKLIATRDAIGPPPNYTGLMGNSFSYATPAGRFNPRIHNLYPIPAREIRENKNLVQNFGY